MFLSRIEVSSLSAIVGIAIVAGLVGGLGMYLYQAAVSWRLRRFVRKNCAACMTPDIDALVLHSHPVTEANRDAASVDTLADFGRRPNRHFAEKAAIQSAAISAGADAQAAAIAASLQRKDKQ